MALKLFLLALEALSETRGEEHRLLSFLTQVQRRHKPSPLHDMTLADMTVKDDIPEDHMIMTTVILIILIR